MPATAAFDEKARDDQEAIYYPAYFSGGPMRLLFSALAAIRVPLAVTAAVIALLFLPDQTREVFAALQEAELPALAVGVAQAVLMIGLFLLVLTLAGLLAIKSPTDYRRAAIVHHETTLRAVTLAAPAVVLVALLLLNLEAAGVGALVTPLLVKLHVLSVGKEFSFASLLILFPAGAAILLALLFAPAFCAGLEKRILAVPFSHPWLTFHRAGWLILSTFALCVVWSVSHVQSFSTLLGIVGVVFLFLSILTAAAGLLARVYDEWHWPVTTILIVAALVFSYFPLNDNHEVRVVAGDTLKIKPVDKAFAEWLKNRPDRESFRGRAYPVYIVAAEGGGIYAAAHAAWTLAGLQDDCPQFAHHLFAISGVSGGSLGATLFSALLDLKPPSKEASKAGWCSGVSTDGPLRNSVKEFFEVDLLTPVLSAGLFPDFLQRLLFFPVPPFDRARALEDAFQRGWRRATVGAGETALATLDKSLFESWRPELSRPALLLNTTAVQFGERVILAPFTLKEQLVFSEYYIDVANTGRFQISLRVAAALSARFPFVTPPGTLPVDAGDRAPIQLVDGGYYDNSATLTALGLVDRLKAAKPPPVPSPDISNSDCSRENVAWFTLPENAEVMPVCIRFIVIRRAPYPYLATYRGDLLSPLAAFSEVWSARSKATGSMLKYRYCGGLRCGFGHDADKPHVYVHSISPSILKDDPDAMARPLPTGWMLSQGTFGSIFQVVEPLECKRGSRQPEEEFSLCMGEEKRWTVCIPRIENRCLTSRVRANLAGEPL